MEEIVDSPFSGLIIVVDGPNFSGKTTLIGEVCEILKKLNVKTRTIKRPLNTFRGERIKNNVASWDDCTQDAIESHQLAVAHSLDGEVVFMDRHIESQAVFQLAKSGESCVQLAYKKLADLMILYSGVPIDLLVVPSICSTTLIERHLKSERKDRPVQLPIQEQTRRYFDISNYATYMSTSIVGGYVRSVFRSAGNYEDQATQVASFAVSLLISKNFRKNSTETNKSEQKDSLFKIIQPNEIIPWNK